MIRIGFGDILHYSYHKEPPPPPIVLVGTYLGPKKVESWDLGFGL